MSFDSMLIHRCTIQRARSTQDAYNNEVKHYSTLIERVPCRLITNQSTRVSTERAERVTATTYTLLVNADVDVAWDDQITDLLDEHGNLDESIYRINGITPRHATVIRHQSLDLEVVS